MKSKLKKFATFLLASVMALSRAFTSLADGSNASGGGSISGNGIEEYTGRYHVYPQNQGTRIYVVNQYGIPVTNLVDIVVYYPEMLFEDINSINDPEMRRVVLKYRHLTGRDNHPKFYIEYLGGAKTDAWYTYNTCIYDMQSILPYIEQIDIDRDNAKTGVVGLYRRDGDYTSAGNTGDSSNTGNVALSETTKMYSYADIELGFRNHAAENGYTENSIITGATTLKEAEFTENGVKVTRPVPQNLRPPLYTNGKGLEATGNTFRDQMMAHIIMKDKDGNEVERNSLQVLLGMKAPVHNGRGIYQVGKGVEPIFQFLDPKLKEEYDKEVAKGNADAMVDVMRSNGLKVAVEPLHIAVGEIVNPYAPAGYNGIFKEAFFSTDRVLYGTPTNIMYYLVDNMLKKTDLNKFGLQDDWSTYNNFLGWLQTHPAMGTTWAWNLQDSAYMLDHDEPGFGMEKYNENMEENSQSNYTLYDLVTRQRTLGYGIMYFFLDDKASGTPTWDSKNYPKENYKPEKSPENTYPDKPNGPFPTEYPSEPQYGANDHKFNIVKFYATKENDGSYTYTENHVRNLTIHTININDEIGYVCDGWFVSPTYKPPTKPNDSYDDWKAQVPKGDQEGNKATSIIVKPESKDTTLYMRLTKAKTLTVIKYYPDQGPQVEENVPWVPVYDAKDPNYTYEEDVQTPDTPSSIPDDWSGVPSGTTGTNPNIPVNPETETIYIKYTSPQDNTTAPLTLHEDELAYTFTLESISQLPTITHEFGDRYASGSGSHGSNNNSWTCSWSRVISDSHYSYTIQNQNNYSSTTFIGSSGPFQSQEIGTNNDQGTLGMSGGTTNGLTPNLKFSVYRDKVKDQVTLYPTKNSDSIKQELQHIGITKESYTPQTKRIQNEGATKWTSTFTTNYQYTTHDNSLSWRISGCSRHGGGSGSWSGSESLSLSALNSIFSQSGNTLTRAYLGKVGKGDLQSTITSPTAFSLFSKNFTKNLAYKAFGDKFIEFYPYTHMKYTSVQKPSFPKSIKM